MRSCVKQFSSPSMSLEPGTSKSLISSATNVRARVGRHVPFLVGKPHPSFVGLRFPEKADRERGVKIRLDLEERADAAVHLRVRVAQGFALDVVTLHLLAQRVDQTIDVELLVGRSASSSFPAALEIARPF